MPTPSPTCSVRGAPDADPGWGQLIPDSSSRSRSWVMIRSTRPASGPSAIQSAARLGRQFDARRIDHEADAAELPGDLRPPTQETEVQAARRPDVEAMAHNVGGRPGSGVRPCRTAAS